MGWPWLPGQPGAYPEVARAEFDFVVFFLTGYESYYNANITTTSGGAANLLTQAY